MSKPSKNMPMPIKSMRRRWNGPTGSRSRRLPALTDVAIGVSPFTLSSLSERRPGLLADPVQPVRFCLDVSVQSPLRCRVAVPVEWLVVGRNHHALGVEMIVETLGAAFASDAGVVDATPGRCRIEAVMIVDPDDAGLDGGGDPVRASDIAGADR